MRELNQLQYTIDSLANLPLIGTLIIEEVFDTQNSLSKRLKAEASKHHQDFSLKRSDQILIEEETLYQDRGANAPIKVGRLTIFSDSSAVIGQIKLDFFIVISTFFKSIALLLKFLWFSKACSDNLCKDSMQKIYQPCQAWTDQIQRVLSLI